MDNQQLKTYFDQNFTRFKEELYDFLRFKSIGTDPDYNADCVNCANWLLNHLNKLGFQGSLVSTSGQPLVLVHRQGVSGSKHLLFYGHYDVQPVDPLELWDSPPFEPREENGLFYARGAQDNKGQLFYVLKGIEALINSNTLNCSLTILIEGEEESGSSGLSAIIPSLAEKLKSDLLLVCDTGMRREGVPAVTVGLRGLVAIEATLRGPAKDLHSGVHGGLCRNPAYELSKMVAALHDTNGRIAIPSFYDNVIEVSPSQLQYIDKLPWSDEYYQSMVGVAANGGELGLHPWIRGGLRPTLEVNGIFGGYTGSGGKTIIPSSATVKLSARLVGGQEPKKCIQLIKDFMLANCPSDLKLEFGREEVAGPAISLSPESECVSTAIQVLKDLHGTEPDLIWEGASIPIVSELARFTNGQALLVGYGLESDNIHAPNENFAWQRFEQGFMYAARVIQVL